MWSIPAERMKMRRPHLVPLSRQTLAALRELHALTGGGKVLFPSYRKPGQVMSATTLNQALKRMGYAGRFSSHGFRSTATTILRSEEHTSELQSLMHISSSVFCLKK